VIERDVPRVLTQQIEAGPERLPPPQQLPFAQMAASERVIDVELRGQHWRIILQLTTDPAVGDWLSVSDRSPEAAPDGAMTRRCVAVRLSLAHPFMDRFGGTDVTTIEPLLRLAAAIGLAETTAREAGVQMAGTFRRCINELLREALSNP
jgi:hypothetical protein